MKNIFIMRQTMESIAHKIRKLYPEMGRAEKKIADYILENSRNITECSVTELAKICGCGDATVVRFSRRLGFYGFQALKIGIAGELGSTSAISSEIKKTDSCFEIFKKRIADISVSLMAIINITAVLLSFDKVMEMTADKYKSFENKNWK